MWIEIRGKAQYDSIEPWWHNINKVDKQLQRDDSRYIEVTVLTLNTAQSTLLTGYVFCEILASIINFPGNQQK